MKLRSGGGTKFLNDNLSPLTRFLESKLGKHWDKIYSELCHKMDPNSMTGQHLIEHLMWYVELNVEIRDGRVYGLDGTGGRYELYWYSARSPTYYVHPKTGCLVKPKRKWKDLYVKRS